MAPPDQVPVHDEAHPGESPRVHTVPPSSPTPSNAATNTTDPKGREKEDNPAVSTAELVSPTMAGPSSSSNTSQPSSVPFSGTATDGLSSSSTSSSPTSRDPVAAALNHEPQLFDVMERPATPPDPAQAPPSEARRNFPAADTLVVVQGVVHTSDVPQSNGRATAAAEIFGFTYLTNPFAPFFLRRTQIAIEQQPVSEETPVPSSGPLSLPPTSIDVLGTLLSVATTATVASLVSGSSDPLLTSGLALPGMQGMQPSPSPISDPSHIHSHGMNQSPGQSQSRPLSPTPTAGFASRDRVRNAWAGFRDRLGLRPSSPTPAPSSPPPLPVISPSPEPEQAPTASRPTSPVDPRTQLLADMARAFQMGMGLDDTPGSGSRSGGAQVSPAIKVASRRTLEDGVDGQPETEPEADREPDRGPQDVGPTVLPLLCHPWLPALPPDDDDLLSDDELDADDEDEDDREPEEETASSPLPTQAESRLAPPASQTPRRTFAGSERRPGDGINWWRMYRFPPMVVAHGSGSGAPGSAPAHSPTIPSSLPSSTSEATATTTDAPRNETLPDVQGAQTQDGNTVVPVIVVGLQSVHGHGHLHAQGQGHRYAEGRDEHPPLPPPLLPQ
ncbi:hypothetical protein EI94DRAFT_1806654 [Lactarius quietus]|nr:hypothetical protein EI94DRAFT_1806654 [Lactarius quietus]